MATIILQPKNYTSGSLEADSHIIGNLYPLGLLLVIWKMLIIGNLSLLQLRKDAKAVCIQHVYYL